MQSVKALYYWSDTRQRWVFSAYFNNDTDLNTARSIWREAPAIATAVVTWPEFPTLRDIAIMTYPFRFHKEL